MEKPKTIQHNVMPSFDILPHPFRAIGRAIVSFIAERHTIPYAEHARGADEMLLGEQRMEAYWQPMLQHGFDETGEFIERDGNER